MAKVFTDNNIELYHTENEGKAIIAERCIRFMKESLSKVQTKNELDGANDNHNNWFYNLDLFVTFYNQHFHRSIRMSPNQARDPINHALLRKILFHRFYSQTSLPAKYKINDKVRIHRYKTLFEKKSSSTNFTEEVFTIHEIKNTVPITYKIKSLNDEIIKGSFMEHELVKVE